MATRSVGSFWWEKCRYNSDDDPVIQRGHGLEENFPWRIGKCLIVRAPGRRHALAVGIWTGKQPQEVGEDGPTLVFREIDRFDIALSDAAEE